MARLEHVDLDAMVSAGSAIQSWDGTYETDRARDAGRAAAAEVERGLQALKAAH